MKFDLQLTTLLGSDIDGLKESFNHLPRTSHKDGNYRLRRYSVVRADQYSIVRISGATSTFKQSSKYNNFQGDIEREFEGVWDEVLDCNGFKEMCHAFLKGNNLDYKQKVEVHQMRIRTEQDFHERATPVSPEGVHQDGFDYIAMVGINRHNVTGGEMLVYRNKNEDPFLTLILNDSDMIMINDRQLWHNATGLLSSDGKTVGYLDVFILTANRNEN